MLRYATQIKAGLAGQFLKIQKKFLGSQQVSVSLKIFLDKILQKIKHVP
jgi:hypothetical protein